MLFEVLDIQVTFSEAAGMQGNMLHLKVDKLGLIHSSTYAQNMHRLSLRSHYAENITET